MACKSPPCALLVGHSFVQRTVEFNERNQNSGLYSRTFGVENLCHVETIRIGGRTVDKMIKFDLQTFRGTAPNVVIMDIRSNHLCDKEVDPDMVALSILALVELLLKDLLLRCLVLCQVLPRKNQPFLGYNKRVWHLNGLLREAVKGIHGVKFWLHCGPFNPSGNIFTRGGIHLNDEGHQALYRSYGGAILFTLNCKGDRHFQS